MIYVLTLLSPIVSHDLSAHTVRVKTWTALTIGNCQ